MNHATFRVQCSEKVLIETSIRTRMSELFPKSSIRMLLECSAWNYSKKVLSECYQNVPYRTALGGSFLPFQHLFRMIL